MEIKLTPTDQASQGLLILAAQHEGIRVDTPHYGDRAVLTKPVLDGEEVRLPCGKKECSRKLILDSAGSAALQCEGYQKFAGQSVWGSGCDYKAYDDYQPAPCATPNPTRQIAERLAVIANYKVEED